jgi:hypothetical protein
MREKGGDLHKYENTHVNQVSSEYHAEDSRPM